MTAWLTLVLHAALIALAAPLLDGFLRRVRAQRQQRPAPPRLQPWHDLVRQWRKPAGQVGGASFVVAIAPPLSCGAAAAAALLAPSFTLGMATAGIADLILVAGLLTLSRLAPVLAAYDAQAILPGFRITAARLTSEPVLLLAALVAATLAGSTNLDAAALRDSLPAMRIPATLAGLALLATFVPDVVNEPPGPAIFSGRDLALITAAAQLRRVASLSIAAVIALPLGIAPPAAGLDAWLVGAAFWLLKLGLLGALSCLGPHRTLLPAAALLALIAAVIASIGGSA